MAKLKSNVSVNYNEGLYYVHYNDIYIFQSVKDNSAVTANNIPEENAEDYEFRLELSQQNYENFRTTLTKDLLTAFPSFQEDDRYLNKSMTQRAIVSNALFTVSLEDSEWAVAVKLTRNKKANTGLQAQMYSSFLHGLRNALFAQFETIYIRNGSWGATPIDASAPADIGNMIVVDEPAFAYEENPDEM